MAGTIVRVTKEMAQQRLADVPQDKQFWCCDGRILNNLAELEAALREMNDDAFLYHSNDVKTDFSNWVRDVIGDDKLSRDLQRSATREQAAKSVASRIAWLRTKLTGK